MSGAKDWTIDENPYVTRKKNDAAENRRVVITMIIVLSVYAAIATFVLSSAM